MNPAVDALENQLVVNLVICDTVRLSFNPYVYISPLAAIELQVRTGDTLYLFGINNLAKTVVTVFEVKPDTKVPLSKEEVASIDGLTIGVPTIVARNLGYFAAAVGATARVVKVFCPQLGSIDVLPVQHPLLNTHVNLWTTYLQPYFYQKKRVVHSGQLLRVQNTLDPTSHMDFQVVKCRIGQKASRFGEVTQDTFISCEGNPVKRSDAERVTSQTTFSSIGGMDSAVKRIKELILQPMAYPDIYHEVGVSGAVGVLLYGPPGTGKTLIAQAVSTEMRSHFITIHGSEIMGNADAASLLTDVFKKAEELAPSVIFIDEVDAIAPKRDAATSHESDRRFVSHLLTLMDGVQGRGNVVVLAATNRQNSIDVAMRRGGRFDSEIEIGVPDEAGRATILSIHAGHMQLSHHPVHVPRLKDIARQTAGYVGADLKAVCQEAGRLAINRLLSRAGVNGIVVRADISKAAVTHEDFAQAVARTEPSATRETLVETPSDKLSDISGHADLTQRLKEMVEFPLTRPDLYEELGISKSHGVLMYGPPGCGKTMIARALAAEMETSFIAVSAPEILSMWQGASEEKIRALFARARAAQPCIIFIDEIDAITQKRDDVKGSNTNTVVNQILTAMDGFGARQTIYVIAATNLLDDIDPALLRPGRFDDKIYVGMPDRIARANIIMQKLQKGKAAGTAKHLHDWATTIATNTDGYSGADMQAIYKEACRAVIAKTVRTAAAAVNPRSKAKGKQQGDAMDVDGMERLIGRVTLEDLKLAQAKIRPSVKPEDLATKYRDHSIK